jgi:four helix bundle protein
VHGREYDYEHGGSSTKEEEENESTQRIPTPADVLGMERAPLDFERLDVYRCAIEFLALSVRVMRHLPRGHADLRDQLRRAATSIPLNIAEASGKTSAPDRARFHAIARGSALECGAILEVLVHFGAVEFAVAEEGKSLLSRIVAMLTKMCR